MSRQATIDALSQHRPVIAPSMLKCNFGRLGAEVDALAKAGAKVLHWDVMDGHFVPNLTYGASVIKDVRSGCDLLFDAHLMISNPDQYVDEFIQAGCDCITFHLEAEPEPAALLERIRSADVACGLVINPETPASALKPWLSLCDMVLVMSVQPGFGGQKFISGSLLKLLELTELLEPGQILAVDGGIGESTITQAARSGADYFVVGSAIFDHTNYQTSLTKLGQLAPSRPSSEES